MQSHLPIILVEGVMVFGGALAFGWWQLRSIRIDREKAALLKAERLAEELVKAAAEASADASPQSVPRSPKSNDADPREAEIGAAPR